MRYLIIDSETNIIQHVAEIDPSIIDRNPSLDNNGNITPKLDAFLNPIIYYYPIMPGLYLSQQDSAGNVGEVWSQGQ
jgi:hypothetical protein